MTNIDSVLLSLRDEIEQNGITGSEIKVKFSYQKNVLPNPIRKTYIILNPEKITVLPYHSEYGYYRNQITYTVGISIHIPEEGNPSILFRDLSFILDRLDEGGVFNIESATCGEIMSDSDTNSIFLPCSIKFTVIC